MKAKRALVAVFVALCVATIFIVACSVWADSWKSKYGQYYRVELLQEAPQDYSVLTDPDPWLLQAINNPGTRVQVENEEESSFHLQPSLDLTFGYSGSFYLTEIIYVDPLPIGVPMRVAQFGVAGSWIAFGIGVMICGKRLSS